MKKLLKIIPICIIIASIIVGLFIRMAYVAIDEFYSPSYISDSSVKADESNKLVSRLHTESSDIALGEYKYSFREAWIEQSTRAEYRWLFFRKTVPTGYRLMLSIEVPSETSDYSYTDNLIRRGTGKTIVCNDSLVLHATVPSIKPNTWLFYGQIQQPFPTSVRCIFRDTQEIYSELPRFSDGDMR